MPKNEKLQPAFDEPLLLASAEGALAAVRAAGARAEALVDAWRDAANAGAVQEVSEHGDGAARKAARRAINVLRSRGVPIPAQTRIAALGKASAPDVVEAWMMAPDSSGMQLFAVTSHAPSGRYRAVFVFLHGTQGIARLENATMSHSQLKEYFAKVLPGAGYGATAVPAPWARWSISAARKAHR